MNHFIICCCLKSTVEAPQAHGPPKSKTQGKTEISQSDLHLHKYIVSNLVGRPPTKVFRHKRHLPFSLNSFFFIGLSSDLASPYSYFTVSVWILPCGEFFVEPFVLVEFTTAGVGQSPSIGSSIRWRKIITRPSINWSSNWSEGICPH